MNNRDEIKKLLFSDNPALEHVWAGHEYRDDQNYYMGAECYKQAADMRNAEGMYNLALASAKTTHRRLNYCWRSPGSTHSTNTTLLSLG